MLRTLKIQGFKSIADLELELGRVNCLIGANGVGKSNVLEALGILGAAASGVVDDESLLRRGVRIFERKRAILHAKAAVADDAAAIMGSANLDARAFYLNREVLATVLDETFAKDLRAELEYDFTQSREVKLQEVDRLPWQQRLKQRLAFAISPLL